jgi:hypothetical protein
LQFDTQSECLLNILHHLSLHEPASFEVGDIPLHIIQTPEVVELCQKYVTVTLFLFYEFTLEIETLFSVLLVSYASIGGGVILLCTYSFPPRITQVIQTYK